MEVENTMKKTVFIIVVILLLIAFGVSAFMVGSYVLESRQQAQRREELAQMAAAATSPSTQATTEPDATQTSTETTEATEATAPTELTILPVCDVYYTENTDTVGYLEIPGTKLANPVMQTPNDPHYYLKHDFDRNYSDWGAVYAWGSADLTSPSDNVTLFGHTMKDGSMFACLHNYYQKSFWEDNRLILFNTLYKEHAYKIYAVFEVSANIGEFAYHQFVDAATEEEFNDFVDTCKALSFYDTGITPVYGDKLLTLSTCTYTPGLDNGRLVVCAVRMY